MEVKYLTTAIEMVQRKDITPLDKFVYSLIKLKCGKDKQGNPKNHCWPKNEYLMQTLGIKQSQLGRCLNRLIASGLITIDFEGNKRFIYLGKIENMVRKKAGRKARKEKEAIPSTVELAIPSTVVLTNTTNSGIGNTTNSGIAIPSTVVLKNEKNSENNNNNEMLQNKKIPKITVKEQLNNQTSKEQIKKRHSTASEKRKNGKNILESGNSLAPNNNLVSESKESLKNTKLAPNNLLAPRKGRLNHIHYVDSDDRSVWEN